MIIYKNLICHNIRKGVDLIFNFLESAGSASVAFQLLSPDSREYFSQAILQSAAATNPWGMVTKKEGHMRALRLAENSNCPYETVRKFF